MTPCTPTASLHDGRDPLPVRLGLSRRVQVMCAGCRVGAESMGVSVSVVERRVRAVAVARDRRRFVPAWLRNLTAVDHTGELVAP